VAKGLLGKFIAGGVVAAIICGFVWGCGKWQSHRAAEKKRLSEETAWTIKKVQLSRLGNQELRDQIASDFLADATTTEDCDWSAFPTWKGSSRNPNWFGSTKGLDGYRVVCDTNAHCAHDKFLSEILFKWDLDSDFRIVGFKWGDAPLD
jgi:hypothetical protein